MTKINLNINNKVGILEIDSPPVNALSLSLVDRLSKAVASLDDSVKILIIKEKRKI